MNLLQINVLLGLNRHEGKAYVSLLENSRKGDFQMSQASTLDECLENLQNEQFDVILLDRTLLAPGITESLKKIDLFSHSTPVIIIGDHPDELFENKILEMGIQDYLVKEMIHQDLLARVLLYSVKEKKNKERLEEELAFRRGIENSRKAEEALGQTQKLESLTILAGGIAHDFNNILTSILGNISLAKSWVDPADRVYNRLNEAEKASLRATDLSNQLLTFAKGRAPIKSLNSLFNILGRSVQFALKGSNVRGQFFFKENLWNVEIDEGQIGQVILNIVINAQQAMPAGGTLQIFGENLTIKDDRLDGNPVKKGNYVKISFKDFGTGIKKEHLPKIFDPYFTTKPKASGLGLSISSSIIKKHEGYITVESILGGGTTVHIYLPASSNKTASGESSKEEKELIRGRGKVLLIDDDVNVREVARVMLRHLGYETDIVAEGREALQLFQKRMETTNPHDVVITDLTHPGELGGMEILQELRELDPQIKVIVSSGHSNDPIMEDPRGYGFTDGIKKPYSIKDLGDVLFRVLVGPSIF